MYNALQKSRIEFGDIFTELSVELKNKAKELSNLVKSNQLAL